MKEKIIMTTPESTESESPPLLSAISSASTSPGDVARTLFHTPEETAGSDAGILNNGADSLFNSDVSVKSDGDDTILDMSTRGRQSNVSPLLMPTSSQNLAKEKARDSSSFAMPATCHGAMSMGSQDLAGIFNIFAGATVKPMGSPDFYSPKSVASENGADTDAVTEVTSNIDHSNINWDRKIDSLERECATLKDIIKADSVRILLLRTELANLRGTGPDVDSQIQSQVMVLRREKRKLLKREELHRETIELLKQELKLLGKASTANKALTKDIEQLQLQNELLASQIVHNESELRSLHVENEGLKEKLIQVQKSQSEDENANINFSSSEMQDQLACIFAKILQIECQLERRDKMFADESRHTHEQLASINELILESEEQYSENIQTKFEPRKQAAEENTNIEVTLEGEIITITSSASEDKENTPPAAARDQIIDHAACCRLCDCIPSSSPTEEN